MWKEIYKVLKNETYPFPIGLPTNKDEIDFFSYQNMSSHLHNIGYKVSILPYIEMVKWVFDHVNLNARKVINDLLNGSLIMWV